MEDIKEIWTQAIMPACVHLAKPSWKGSLRPYIFNSFSLPQTDQET